ncbi:hypothetical protein PAXRUDRAFT_160017, partial [Paxillus rubicundulus Ve08.2h10]
GHKTENCWGVGGRKHGQVPKGWKSQERTEEVKEPEATMTLPYAMVINSSIAELYDSGTSQHFSPFHDQFIRFKTIPPRPISTADKRSFQAIG